MIRKALKWLWAHFGWGWHGHSIDKLFKRRINPNRQAIKAYCAKYGLTRKEAKKQDRRARMWVLNQKQIRKARYDGWKAGTVR